MGWRSEHLEKSTSFGIVIQEKPNRLLVTTLRYGGFSRMSLPYTERIWEMPGLFGQAGLLTIMAERNKLEHPGGSSICTV